MIPDGTIALGSQALNVMRRLHEQATQPGAELSGFTRRDLGEIVAIALRLNQSIDQAPTEMIIELMDTAVVTLAMRHTHPTVPFTDDVRRRLKIVRDDINRLMGE